MKSLLCIKGNIYSLRNRKCNLKLHELLKSFSPFLQYVKEAQYLKVHVKPNIMGAVELLAMINKPGASLCTTLFSFFVICSILKVTCYNIAFLIKSISFISNKHITWSRFNGGINVF